MNQDTPTSSECRVEAVKRYPSADVIRWILVPLLSSVHNLAMQDTMSSDDKQEIAWTKFQRQLRNNNSFEKKCHAVLQLGGYHGFHGQQGLQPLM